MELGKLKKSCFGGYFFDSDYVSLISVALNKYKFLKMLFEVPKNLGSQKSLQHTHNTYITSNIAHNLATPTFWFAIQSAIAKRNSIKSKFYMKITQ